MRGQLLRRQVPLRQPPPPPDPLQKRLGRRIQKDGELGRLNAASGFPPASAKLLALLWRKPDRRVGQRLVEPEIAHPEPIHSIRPRPAHRGDSLASSRLRSSRNSISTAQALPAGSA